jgi:hypothetical protein
MNQWVIFGVILTGGAVIYLATSPAKATYPITDFINADAVAHIAAQLPQDEDQFILSAWQIASEVVKYKPFGSVLEFYDSTVECQNCLLPDQMLRMKDPKSNCVGKSVLLTSLLRTRLPADRVYMAVGTANFPSRAGGHAWVVVDHRGSWELLETTVPLAADPWRSAMELEQHYKPDAFVNDKRLFCSTGSELCLHTAHIQVQGICPCRH